MSKTQPKVSAIIPSYNRFKYLKNAVDSVLNQNYKNLEIIIINDGSDEEEYYNHKFPKSVKIVHLKQNQKKIHGFGPGAIRNFGTDQASGDYLAFLDDDDIWLPDKLSIQIETMYEKKYKMSCTEGFIGEGVYVQNKNYKQYNSQYYLKKIKRKYKNTKYLRFNKYPENFTYDFLKIHNCIITSSVVVEKKLFDNMGKFRNLPLSADYDCWLGLLQLTNCIYIDIPLFYYDFLHAEGRNYFK
tara:strand:+ start:432 stop:1157 length:726 start_codon:yes stop_codon:yes gene_type:complete